MSLPFRQHLTWMILEGLSNEEIRRFYDDIQFVQPPHDYIEALHLRLAETFPIPPSTKRNLKKSLYSPADEALWTKLGFRELYLHRVGKGTQEEKDAISCLGKLLNHPVMRVALDCSLIARLPIPEASEILPQTFSIPLSEAAIVLYKKYFLCTESMTKKDWIYFLQQLQDDSYSYTRYYAALTRSQEEVMHLVGLPSRKQYIDFLRNVLATSDFKFRHYARHGTPEGEAEARKWAKLGVDAGEKQKKFESRDQGDLLRHIQTEFEYVDSPIPIASPELIAQMLPPPDPNAPVNSGAASPHNASPQSGDNFHLGI